MNRVKRLLPILAVLLGAACASVPPAAPPAAGAAGPLPVDPRLGFTGAAARDAERTYQRAIQDLAAGRTERARQRLAEIPQYRPATLALGALALQQGSTDAAGAAIERATAGAAPWAAGEFYRAELAAARDDIEGAIATLEPLSADPAAPPVVRQRLEALQTRLFDSLYASALSADPATATPALRRALALRPDSTAARLLLVQKLIAGGRLADARVEIDPLLGSPEAERVEVQQALAEIDAGRRRYQEAIARYERIVEIDPRPQFTARLEELKNQFASANMPPRFRTAAASGALTRAELAILTYWIVSDVRFGRVPGEPLVAVDLGDAVGREELIRAIALRLIPVDPATRLVRPDRVVTAAEGARVLARVLLLRGNPACAAEAGGETVTTASAIRLLAGCGIDTAPLQLDVDAPLGGAWARRALERIETILSRKQ